MNEEEKKAIECLKTLIGLEEYNKLSYIENKAIQTTLNLISKLQKELDKSNNRLDMCVDLLNLEGCLKFDTKQEKLDYIDRLVEIDKASYFKILEEYYKKAEEENE